jgi:hypothetical protein
VIIVVSAARGIARRCGAGPGRRINPLFGRPFVGFKMPMSKY